MFVSVKLYFLCLSSGGIVPVLSFFPSKKEGLLIEREEAIVWVEHFIVDFLLLTNHGAMSLALLQHHQVIRMMISG